MKTNKTVLPLVFAILSLICSFVRYILVKFESTDNVTFSHKVSLTSFFDGNPNIIAILACLSMILCIFLIPKSMVKPHKSGDGLGAMFMPLGLLAIFEAMCTIENVKDMSIGVFFAIALFLISALGTFKKTIYLVEPLCIFMILVAFFLILAGFMPYCYNVFPFAMNEQSEIIVSRYYYLSYFIRDILLLISYGLLANNIKNNYKKIETAAEVKKAPAKRRKND
ncbi:MAG: hypothetical protein ACI39R_00155 [Lachnospiraceae bacterium]